MAYIAVWCSRTECNEFFEIFLKQFQSPACDLAYGAEFCTCSLLYQLANKHVAENGKLGQMETKGKWILGKYAYIAHFLILICKGKLILSEVKRFYVEKPL